MLGQLPAEPLRLREADVVDREVVALDIPVGGASPGLIKPHAVPREAAARRRAVDLEGPRQRGVIPRASDRKAGVPEGVRSGAVGGHRAERGIGPVGRDQIDRRADDRFALTIGGPTTDRDRGRHGGRLAGFASLVTDFISGRASGVCSDRSEPLARCGEDSRHPWPPSSGASGASPPTLRESPMMTMNAAVHFSRERSMKAEDSLKEKVENLGGYSGHVPPGR